MAITPASDPAHARHLYARLLMTEAVAGVAVSILLGGIVAWLGYHKLTSIPVWGRTGLVVDMVPSTAVPALLMVLVLPIVVTRRLAGDRLAALAAVAPLVWPRGLADRPVWRGALFVAAATAIAVIMSAAPLLLTGTQFLSPSALVALKLAQNGLLGLVGAPLIAAHMLADRRHAASARR